LSSIPTVLVMRRWTMLFLRFIELKSHLLSQRSVCSVSVRHQSFNII
jgi:hypothetical protein